MNQATGYCAKCKDDILKPVIGKREKSLCNTHYWESKRQPIVSAPVEITRTPIVKDKNYVIPKVSKKQAKRNAQYLKQRGPYLLANPYCVIRRPGCKGLSNQVHHGCGRVGDNYLDEETWRAACTPCHQWVENNPEEAKELGHSLTRTK